MKRSTTRPGAGVASAALLCVLVLVAGCTREPTEPPAPTGPAPTAERTEPPGPVEVTLTEVATADAPTAGVAGPDDTLWIAERGGRVRVLADGELSEPVLDISAETTTDGERGLLGIAFNREYTRFYLSFTDRAGGNVVDEIQVVDGVLRTDRRRTLLTQEQPFANHNGGDLAFGPDDMLYIGLGDGGQGGDPLGSGQDLGTLLGALLRIDPGGDPYAIPPDNPFVDDPAARDEIWAYGLRNPWRFSFDAETGDLWIADVGQNAREEVDMVPAGAGGGQNFGWSEMEGSLPYDGGREPARHVPPVFEYDTTGERCSITGGYVYRGDAVSGLFGQYVFSDYCEGTIRALATRDGEVVAETDLGVNGGAVVAFAQGPDRELYVLDLAGSVHRLDPS